MRKIHFSINSRLILLAQLFGSLAVIAWVPGNIAKTVTLILWWAATFRSITGREFAMYVIACIFFTTMDVASLKQGIFAFTQPDFLGMPMYEFFMWGFYLLHTKRMIRGAPPRRSRVVWGLGALYSIAFSTISDQDILLAATGILLTISLAACHKPLDFAYVGYMVFLGAAVEYTGVYSGQWFYPGHPVGAVPIWFMTLWGGVGFFLRRLILPIVGKINTPPLSHHDASLP